jgi:hypothetical protein
VLRYLGRYTHRVAISNHRLLAFEPERVTFRFFLHVLPKGFVRIRHSGFLANRFRASHLALCRVSCERVSGADASGRGFVVQTLRPGLDGNQRD